ncbi:hypothetical protein [Bradyrhizobium sp. S3.2.12]|uniref:hypothetical protein n=1 Tax=Bradyrhizobium sp. S3.2.12 TaxID=3156387 RepID=UPI00339887DA
MNHGRLCRPLWASLAGKKGKPVSPIAWRRSDCLDALFAIERAMNGRRAEERRAAPGKGTEKPFLEDMYV